MIACIIYTYPRPTRSNKKRRDIEDASRKQTWCARVCVSVYSPHTDLLIRLHGAARFPSRSPLSLPSSASLQLIYNTHTHYCSSAILFSLSFSGLASFLYGQQQYFRRLQATLFFSSIYIAALRAVAVALLSKENLEMYTGSFMPDTFEGES